MSGSKFQSGLPRHIQCIDRSFLRFPVIAVYGLVVSVLIAGALSPSEPYSLFGGFIHLSAGLACGMTGLAAGYAIGIVGDVVSVTGISDAGGIMI